jgi:hypothetical protein
MTAQFLHGILAGLALGVLLGATLVGVYAIWLIAAATRR